MALVPTRRTKAIAYGVAAVVTIGIALAVWLRPPSLEEVARRGLEAVATGDGDLLLRNLTTGEVNRLGLTRDRLNRFLGSFVKPRLTGFVPSGAAKLTPLTELQQLYAVQDYVHPDGRRVGVGMSTAVTTGGPRITSAIVTITLSALGTDVPAGATFPQGRARHAFWAASLEKALPTLAGTGVPGLLRQGTPSGRDEFFTFKQFSERSQRLGRGKPASGS